jgi:5-methylthioribose kinase
VKVLAGGISNRTVSVRRSSGDAWVVKQALSKLRVKVDWFSDPMRVHREAAGLRWFNQIEVATPRLVFEDFEHHLIAMDAVGEPHENWKTMLLRGEVVEDHVRQFGAMLGRMHAEAARRREQTALAFADRSFFESLRLEPYYLYTAEQVGGVGAAFLRELVNRTRATAHSIVHGDYSPKNVLVREGKLILLDHEVIHFGDPAFDIGFAMAHLLSKAHHLAECQEKFARAADLFWETHQGLYESKAFEERAVQHSLGCLLARVAGRSQLEYLSDGEKARQRDEIVAMMGRPPQTIRELIERFVKKIRGG